jgi:probable rRNA maturation factor
MNEILLLTAHGILHLLGFDHSDPEEEKEMFGIQKSILEAFYESESV